MLGHETRASVTAAHERRHSTASIRRGPASPSARSSSRAEIFRRSRRARRARPGPSQAHPVDRRLRQPDQLLRLRTQRLHAGARHLDPEDAVAAVVADDRRDVQLLARLRPERLERVHPAAVGLQADDAALRTRDGGARRTGQAQADRAARLHQHRMRRRRLRQRRGTAPCSCCSRPSRSRARGSTPRRLPTACRA